MAATFVQGGPGSTRGVQSSGTVTAAAGQSLAFASNVTVGNVIFCLYAVEGASSLLTAAVTDSLVNTWTDDKNFTSVTTGGGSRVGVVHSIVTTGGACTVTVKPSGTGFVSFGLVEVSGLDTGSLVGGNNGARGTSTAPDSGSVTPVSASDLLMGVCAHDGGGTVTIVAAGSNTLMYVNTSTANEPIGTEEQTIAAGTSAAFTLGVSNVWACVGVSYRILAPKSDPAPPLTIPRAMYCMRADPRRFAPPPPHASRRTRRAYRQARESLLCRR